MQPDQPSASLARLAARCRDDWESRRPRWRLAVSATPCMCSVSRARAGVVSYRPLHARALESHAPQHCCRTRPPARAHLLLYAVWRGALPQLPRPLPHPSQRPLYYKATLLAVGYRGFGVSARKRTAPCLSSWVVQRRSCGPNFRVGILESGDAQEFVRAWRFLRS